MLRFRVGQSGSRAAARAMARYFDGDALRRTAGEEQLATYLAAEEPLAPIEGLAKAVADGHLLSGSALDVLMRGALARPENAGADLHDLEARLSQRLAEATVRLQRAEDRSSGAARSAARVLPLTGQRAADALGIDLRRDLTVEEIGHLLVAATRADGEPVAGKQVQAPRLAIAEVFGLDDRTPPTGDAVLNVLAGKRADGGAPHTADGRAIPAPAIAGARRRYLTLLAVPGEREPSAAEVDHLVAGHTARGLTPTVAEYRAGVSATNAPVAYLEMVFSADKTLSVAWALAPSEGERAALMKVHTDAVAGAAAHARHLLAHAGIGKARSGGIEPAEMAAFSFTHTTSRPSVQTIAYDEDGRPYTDERTVPVVSADPQLHDHAIAPNVLVTESGRVTGIDLDRIGNGGVKETGGVYQALVAQGLRTLGVAVSLDRETGAARLDAIPERVRAHYSGRHNEGMAAARAYAAAQGIEWDGLSEAAKRALMASGAAATRRGKDAGEITAESDFALWRERAQALRYAHRSVLRPDDIRPELAPAQRHALAYRSILPMVDDLLRRHATITEAQLREIVPRGLIVAGVGNPAEDIAAVTTMLVTRGVRQDGQPTKLIIERDKPVRGQERLGITTALHAGQEAELIALAAKAHADRSRALRLADVELAAARSGLDFSGAHGQAQLAMMAALATGGRLGVGIGVAGSGKTSVIAPLVDAWLRQGEGRRVYGATLAWEQADRLVAAGVPAANNAAMDAFLARAARGTYALDDRALVVVDEVGQIGTRQLLELLRLQDRHGFTLYQIGDPKQCQAIAAGDVIDLLRRAVGPASVPEILTSRRQEAARDREIVGLFREGRAAEALAMKQQDGTLLVVAGGEEKVIAATAALWRARMEANRHEPGYTLGVTDPTNEGVGRLSEAIRREQRALGLLGDDRLTITAIDNRRRPFEMNLAIGDQVRFFDRVHDAGVPKGGPRRVLASNGSVATVIGVTPNTLTIRNAAGVEGVVALDRLRDRKHDPVRLAYGAALTIDAGQGMTRTEHIASMLGGSSKAGGFKAHVGESRAERRTFTVIDEAAERRQVMDRRPRGDLTLPTRETVMANVAKNLSAMPDKGTATELLDAARTRKREATRGLHLGQATYERRTREASLAPRRLLGVADLRRVSMPHVAERIHDLARSARAVPRVVVEIGQRVREKNYRQRGGPSIGQKGGPSIGR